jgi:hypothetical protein
MSHIMRQLWISGIINIVDGSDTSIPFFFAFSGRNAVSNCTSLSKTITSLIHLSASNDINFCAACLEEIIVGESFQLHAVEKHKNAT